MDVLINGRDMTPQMAEFVDSLRPDNAWLDTIEVLPCEQFGRELPNKRIIKLTGKEINLSALLYRTTDIEVTDLSVKRSGPNTVASLTVKLPEPV